MYFCNLIFENDTLAWLFVHRRRAVSVSITPEAFLDVTSCSTIRAVQHVRSNSLAPFLICFSKLLGLTTYTVSPSTRPQPWKHMNYKLLTSFMFKVCSDCLSILDKYAICRQNCRNPCSCEVAGAPECQLARLVALRNVPFLPVASCVYVWRSQCPWLWRAGWLLSCES